MVSIWESKRGAYAYAVAIIVLFIVLLLIVYVFPEVGDFIVSIFQSGNGAESAPVDITP